MGNAPRILETFLIDMEISRNGAIDGLHGIIHHYFNGNARSHYTKDLEIAQAYYTTDRTATQTTVS